MNFDATKLTELHQLVYSGSILTGYSAGGKVLFHQEIHKYEKVIVIVKFLETLGMHLAPSDTNNEISFKRHTPSAPITPHMISWINNSL